MNAPPFIADMEAEAAEDVLRLDLPYPHKLLWPNGSRGSPRALGGEKRKHKEWAHMATLAIPLARRRAFAGTGPFTVHLIVRPKPRGPLPDRDNCVAALKAYQDSIAAALGLNDKHFLEPTVEFAQPRDGRFIVELGR